MRKGTLFRMYHSARILEFYNDMFMSLENISLLTLQMFICLLRLYSFKNQVSHIEILFPSKACVFGAYACYHEQNTKAFWD